MTAAIYGSVMIKSLHYIIAGRTSEIHRIADELLALILDGVT